MTVTTAGPEPTSFQIVPSDPPAYYNITTEAVWEDSIELCMTYDDSDLTPEEEELLTVQHYDGLEWTNITSSLDTASNTICGITDSLSPFVVAKNSCCIELTGNVDNDPSDVVDLGDLTKLIDYLFISFTEPECIEEANIDGDAGGLVDLGDLTALIDYLFITFTPPAECL